MVASTARLAVLLAVVLPAVSFIPSTPVGRLHGLTQLRSVPSSSNRRDLSGSVMMQNEDCMIPPGRREFARLLFGAAASIVAAPAIHAEVFFDTERYGDKELKVALINQVKQQFRALYEKKPDMIIPLFKLAMTDALTFDPKTGSGGLDGGILRKQDDPAYAYLKPAFAEIERIRQDLLAKTEVSKADLIAFAGAVAIEATGGPRVKLQLGRLDGKKEQPASNMMKWDPVAPTSAGIKEAIMGSGLTIQETVLLAGVIGQLRSAGKAMTKSLEGKVACNPADDDCQSEEEGYYGMYSPVTIVSETSRQFGKNRGASAVNSNTGFDSARIAGLAGDAKFSNSYLVSVAKGEANDNLGKALLGDDELKKWVMEYGKSSSSNKFGKDAVAAYLKMVELGRSNTR